jgi:hypothetical protein
MQAWMINIGKKNMGNNAKETWEVFAAGPPLGLNFSVWRSGETRIASISTNIDLPAFLAEDFAKGEGFLRDRFWFVKYKVTGDKLEIWAPDAKFLTRAIKKESLKGSVEDVLFLPEIHVDETPENLRRFVEQNLDRGLFLKDPIATFNRVAAAKP